MNKYRVRVSDWTLGEVKLPTDLVIEAHRCCFNAGWIMFYDNADVCINAWPTWRVLEISKV